MQARVSGRIEVEKLALFHIERSCFEKKVTTRMRVCARAGTSVRVGVDHQPLVQGDFSLSYSPPYARIWGGRSEGTRGVRKLAGIENVWPPIAWL